MNELFRVVNCDPKLHSKKGVPQGSVLGLFLLLYLTPLSPYDKLLVQKSTLAFLCRGHMDLQNDENVFLFFNSIGKLAFIVDAIFIKRIFV